MENRAALRGQGGVDSAAKASSPAGGVHTLLATIPQGRISIGLLPRVWWVGTTKGTKFTKGLHSLVCILSFLCGLGVLCDEIMG